MAQARALPAQNGHPMSQGDKFELQGEAITKPERERGTEGGQKREHADDGMTAAPETLCFRTPSSSTAVGVVYAAIAS